MAYILIIEDDDGIRNMTELILAEAGHAVASANNGLCGVAMATCVHPDLILMDLGLPQLDGWKATRCLKADASTNHIPIIAFTALLSASATRQATLAGCEAIIAKPFELDTLLDVITSLLAKHAQADEQSTNEHGGEW